MYRPYCIALVCIVFATPTSLSCKGGSAEKEASTGGAKKADEKVLKPAETASKTPKDAKEYVPNGFTWVVDDKVAGMGHPGAGPTLDKTLSYLKGQGVDLFVSLTMEPADEKAVKAHGMKALHMPVKDYTPPTQEQLATFVKVVKTETDAGRKVTVHCVGGKGRTGTMLAGWFISKGMSAKEAIAHVRKLRPGSIETKTQEAALEEFAKAK